MDKIRIYIALLFCQAISFILPVQAQNNTGNNSNRYNTQYSYDCMGNITSLSRNGLLDDGCYQGLSSLNKTTTYANAFSVVVEDRKTVFDAKASTYDRLAAGVSLASEILSPVSVKDVREARNLARKFSYKIIANGGVSKPHGGKAHNSAIDKRIEEQHQVCGSYDFRKNQTQVDANGNKVGNTRMI